MSEKFHRKFSAFVRTSGTREGKITIFTSLTACLVIVFAVAFFEVNVPVASADDVTTSVTVLNTPPAWTVDANESTESSTSTPTNAGTTLSFTATGTDSSGDSYYLLICKTSGAPTANPSAPPTCNGVGNQWAISSLTTSGAQATAATTTTNVAPFNLESNDWYGWICDQNASVPRCNIAYTQGSSVTASPFVINHVPVFYSIGNDGPINPGGSITWTSGSYDNDTLGSTDQVRLVVCRSAGLTNGVCTGSGGAFATSTLSNTNAATTTPFGIPNQDRFYNSFVYIVDNHNLAATSTLQGSVSVFQIQNVAPTISAALVSLVDTDNVGNLTLSVPAGRTSNFKVQFEISDNNSCLTASSTPEIASAIANIYRSGVTQANCDSAGEYNQNNCYAAGSAFFGDLSCTQDGASCSGATDSTVTYTCTFGLWHNADPTDASTPWTAENWLASVRATDNNATSSALVEGTTGNELVSFLAFDVSQSTVAFGSLEPGQSNDPIAATTTMMATGNVGLDQDVYGDTMCTTWSGPDSCDTGGINAASEIAINYQKVAFATSTSYAAATTLAGSTTPVSLLVNVPKTVATTSPAQRNTYFGIQIPVAITVAGNYTGQDTIVGKVSNFTNW